MFPELPLFSTAAYNLGLLTILAVCAFAGAYAFELIVKDL